MIVSLGSAGQISGRENRPDTHFQSQSQTLFLCVLASDHGLNQASQQGVWVPFWTPKPLKRTCQDTQSFSVEFSKNLNPSL